MRFGVDPGLKGAISVFSDDGVFVEHGRMPVMERQGENLIKKQIDPRALHGLIDSLTAAPELVCESMQGSIAYLETPTPIPTDGPLRIASFAHSIGVTESVFMLMGIKVINVKPHEWKKTFDLMGKEKKQAIPIALEFAPQLGSIKIKDLDVAESILIGQYGIKYRPQ